MQLDGQAVEVVFDVTYVDEALVLMAETPRILDSAIQIMLETVTETFYMFGFKLNFKKYSGSPGICYSFWLALFIQDLNLDILSCSLIGLYCGSWVGHIWGVYWISDGIWTSTQHLFHSELS